MSIIGQQSRQPAILVLDRKCPGAQLQECQRSPRHRVHRHRRSLDRWCRSDRLISEIYKGKQPGDHMRNFYECVVEREQPISDVHTHHRALTTCHLANIAIRLGRKLNWDPQTEQIVGDPDANGWQSREQRKGYEINVPV